MDLLWPLTVCRWIVLYLLARGAMTTEGQSVLTARLCNGDRNWAAVNCSSSSSSSSGPLISGPHSVHFVRTRGYPECNYEEPIKSESDIALCEPDDPGESRLTLAGVRAACQNRQECGQPPGHELVNTRVACSVNNRTWRGWNAVRITFSCKSRDPGHENTQPRPYQPTPTREENQIDRGKAIGIGLGVGLPVAAAILLLAVVLIIRERRRGVSGPQAAGSSESPRPPPAGRQRPLSDSWPSDINDNQDEFDTDVPVANTGLPGKYTANQKNALYVNLQQ